MLHVLPLSVAADGVFTLSDRTEARARAPDPITNAVALDIDTLIDARAVWTARDATYTLADLPRFTLLDYNGAAIAPAFLDSLMMSGEWRRRRVRIRVLENASYGQLSFESLAALPGPGTPQAAPTPAGPAPLPGATQVPNTGQSILYASSDTSVGSTLQLRPWTVLTRVGYQLTGGVNDAAQQVLPFQKGPYADATADYKLRAHDHLVTFVSGSETSFTPLGTEDLLAEIDERWRHEWSRRTQTMFALGWYAARTRAGADDPDVFASNPVAEAELDHDFSRRGSTSSIRLDVRLAPFVNRLTGLVDEQIRGSLEASWGRRRWRLRAGATAAESVDQGTATSTRLGFAEIGAAYKVSEALTFDGGFRAIYQEQDFQGAPPAAGGAAPIVESTLSQGVVFIAVTVRAVKTKL
jgi:hypothetical protein